MKKKTNRRHLFLGAVLAACLPVVAQAQATPASKFEIAGIRLGMTEAEARAAIQAFEPGFGITAFHATYQYTDGVGMQNTPEFLDRLEARGKTLDNTLTVWFSGPVGDVRVIAIRRQASTMPNPPTAAQFTQSLVGKYGKPDGYNGSNANPRLPVWEEAGKPSCSRMRNGTYAAASILQLTHYQVDSIEGYFAKRSSSPVTAYATPADLSTCGAVLDYDFKLGDPVQTFTAELKDIGALVKTDRARNAWVNQLQDEATKKRLGQGQAPKL